MTRTYAEWMSESILKQAMAFSMKLDIVFSALPGPGYAAGTRGDPSSSGWPKIIKRKATEMDPVRN